MKSLGGSIVPSSYCGLDVRKFLVDINLSTFFDNNMDFDLVMLHDNASATICFRSSY